MFELAASLPRAGELLVQRYLPKLERYFRAKVNDWASADDLVCDTLCAVLTAVVKPRAEPVEDVAAFIVGIARNKLRAYYRNKRALAEGQERFEQYSVLELEGPGPFDMVAMDRKSQLLAHALRRISIADQTLILWCYWDEFPRAKIGELLGIKTGTVRSRLFAAIERLRKQHRLLERGIVAVHETSRALHKWQLELRAAGGDDSF